MTGRGGARSADGRSFGNWFRKRCNEAGLPHCSAHGLRKVSGTRLADAGASHEQIKSVTGHVTDQEASKYTAKANKRRLAEQAQNLLSDRAKGESGTEIAESQKQVRQKQP
ncbi:MAG: tyrosine-type recombinase/integrase [Hyphomicrobiales bacterium]